MSLLIWLPLHGNLENYGNSNLTFKLVNKKAITASQEELAMNNRSHSAKLRVIEKL